MRPAWIVKLIEAEEEAPIPPPREADRRAAINAIESAIRVRAQRRSRSRVVYGVAAAAAVLFAVGGGALLARRGSDATRVAATPTASATVSGDGVVVDGASATTAPLAQGGHVAVREGGHATVALSTGTELALGDRGDLGVVEDGRSQIFALGAGSVRARVAKLHDGERFIVRTPDAEVEVRGTVFTVSIVPADSCGTVTRVAVEEGVVVVRRNGVESRVARGERWPADCVATPPASPAPIAVDDLDEPAAKKPSKKPTPAPSATTSAASSLAEQ
ncbi:MAG TPA: FecR domain-containing protein, partial [Labilithrix sp.]